MLNIKRHFTKENQTVEDIYSEVEWLERDAIITDHNGNEIFAQRGVMFPTFWSENAVKIVSSKYFYGKMGTGEREHSLRDLISRVVDKIAEEGLNRGYFGVDNFGQYPPSNAITLLAKEVSDNESLYNIFRCELTYILLHQHFSFNSPVYFNIGTPNKQNPSACFILGPEDNLESIFEHAKTEGLIFRDGSGAGSNLSKLRAEGEPIKGGGTSSGVLSFNKIYESVASATKSGGRSRRAARMVILDVDHPEIEAFIACKSKEEDKARALIAAGYDDGLNGEAYSTVTFQNANHSVRITDKFMKAVENDGDWDLINRSNGKVAKTLKARYLWDLISKSAWETGEPGIQFDDTIQKWNTVASSGKVEASNPCLPSWSRVIILPSGSETPRMITLEKLNIGDSIWTSEGWTKVTAKFLTGTKKVYEYNTTFGTFYSTENHEVVSEGSKIQVGIAESIDALDVPLWFEGEAANKHYNSLSPNDIMIGLLIGDGSVHKASNNLIYLNIGKNDSDYFDSEISHLIGRDRTKAFKYGYEVDTILDPIHLMKKTYERVIPDEYTTNSATQICGILRGIYSANGSVVDGRVTLKSASFELIKQVQLLLASLGIQSYYTINKPTKVKFTNGEYVCKQSYDLNITRDRKLFYTYIGFLQEYKNQALINYINNIQTTSKPRPSTYQIISKKLHSIEDVFDITVDNKSHTFWCNGFNVSNCSEFLGLNFTSCNLASINLLDNHKLEFLGWENIKYITELATIAMNILIDFGDYPTEKIAKETRAYRNIGIGFTNLGALLMLEGMPYDSDKGRNFAADIMSFITLNAYKQSHELAKVFGSFEKCKDNRLDIINVMNMHLVAAPEHTKYGWDNFIKDLTGTVDEKGGIHLRNASVSLLAPCGTINFFMDGITSGVEPALSLVTYKKLVGGGTIKATNPIVEKAIINLGYNHFAVEDAKKFIERHGTLEDIPTGNNTYNVVNIYNFKQHLPIFDCALKPANGTRTISPEGHVRMLAALQPHLSHSISKTVNLPNECTVEDIENIYMLAWKLGVKCVAVYRDGCKVNQPMSTSEKKEKIIGVVVQTNEKIPTEWPEKKESKRGPNWLVDKMANTSPEILERVKKVFDMPLDELSEEEGKEELKDIIQVPILVQFNGKNAATLYFAEDADEKTVLDKIDHEFPKLKDLSITRVFFVKNKLINIITNPTNAYFVQTSDYRDLEGNPMPQYEIKSATWSSKEAELEKEVAQLKKELQQKTRITRKRLPATRRSITHKVSIGDNSFYIITGFYDDGRVGEIFLNNSKHGSFASGTIDTIAKLISIMLQYDIPIDELVDGLKGISFAPNGMTSNKEIQFAKSIVDYVAKYLEKEFVYEDIGEPDIDEHTAKELNEMFLYGKNCRETKKEEMVSTDIPPNLGFAVGIPPTKNNVFTTDDGETMIMATNTKEVGAILQTGQVCRICGDIMVTLGRCFFCTNCNESTGGCGN